MYLSQYPHFPPCIGPSFLSFGAGKADTSVIVALPAARLRVGRPVTISFSLLSVNGESDYDAWRRGGANLGTKSAKMHHQHVVLTPSQALVSYQMEIKLDTTESQFSHT